MKLNLDAEPAEMGIALTTAFRVIAENPNQEEGTAGEVVLKVNNVSYIVTRNEDSWTVRVP